LVLRAQKKDENLDFCYPRTAINKKAFKTRTLLNFIAKNDNAFTPATLEQHAKSTFIEAQKNWEKRDYAPMRTLMMPDLWAAQSEQLAGLRRNHEINVIADLDIENVDIVNVRYTHKPSDREFTALITAKSRDYYIDDRSMKFIRGDHKPARFQEFWTFQWQDGAWLVREIEQTRESDALKDENFFEQFTDTGRDQIYGEEAGREGPAGPWLEKDVATKATRIERMLNFLVQTDKIWNRQKMIQRARDVFTKVILTRESGNVADIPTGDLSPDLAAALRQEIESRRAAGESIEFRNFCIRKAELILIRNYVDRDKDEFSARISAHAQKNVLQNGQTIRADEYVSPFEAFCVFTRAGNQWNLKEILPSGRGKNLLTQENLDEESTPDQVQWYYKQTRAN
jgi:predicted lipid-binding transport protein (Tim44 family)